MLGPVITIVGSCSSPRSPLFRIGVVGTVVSTICATMTCASFRPQRAAAESLDTVVFRSVVRAIHAPSWTTLRVDPRPLRAAPAPMSSSIPELSNGRGAVKARSAVLQNLSIPTGDAVAQWSCKLSRGNPAPPGPPVRSPATSAESAAVQRQLRLLATCSASDPFLIVIVGVPQPLGPTTDDEATLVVRVLEFAQDHTRVYDDFLAVGPGGVPRIVRQKPVSAAFL